MYVETIGNRRYAFGLQWIDRGEDLAESLREAIDDGQDLSESKIYTTSSTGRRKGGDYGTVGFFTTEKKQPKALYSAAAIIAAKCDDGLYVLPMEGGNFWYCAVRSGIVIEGTDVIADAPASEESIEELAATLELDIRLDSDSASEAVVVFDASEPFGIRDFLAHAKPRPMRLYKHSPGLLLPVVIIAVLVLGGAYFYTTSKPSHEKLTPAQKRARALSQYLSGAKRRIGAYPTTNAWALKAFRDSVIRFPPYFSGWTLHDVACLPAACTATYTVKKGQPYQLSPFNRRFPQVQVGRNGHDLTVTHTLTTPLVPVTQSWLRTLPLPHTSLTDWIGAVPLAMPGAEVVSSPLTADLGQQFHASKAGMPGAVMEQVQIGGGQWLTESYLAGLVGSGQRGGFRILKMQWTADPTNGAKWTLVWGRVHG